MKSLSSRTKIKKAEPWAIGQNLFLTVLMALMFTFVGIVQSWNVAFLFSTCVTISTIMSLGVNIQWGYAGLFNAGVMGFAALGGLAAVLFSMAPVTSAWAVGGRRC